MCVYIESSTLDGIVNIYVSIEYDNVSSFFQDYYATHNYSLIYLMDVLQNNRTVGTVFPDYVTVDIFNAILYCNQFLCDFDRLKQFDHISNSPSSKSSAYTIGINYLCNWRLIVFLCLYLCSLIQYF